MKEIEFNGVKVTLTKEQLETALKEFDKPEFKFKTTNGRDLFVNGRYVYSSIFSTSRLITNLNQFWANLSEELGIPTLSSEEKLDINKTGYSLELAYDYTFKKVVVRRSWSTDIYLQRKIWTEEGCKEMEDIILNNEMFMQWFDRKFNK